jgi:xanthine/CO dehydrogenase XdhC/CoxF family maturation factor
MPASVLDAVHAPIGLDIGAVTPAEIAVSILAELIAVRSGRIEAIHVQQATLRRVQAPGEGRV